MSANTRENNDVTAEAPTYVSNALGLFHSGHYFPLYNGTADSLKSIEGTYQCTMGLIGTAINLTVVLSIGFSRRKRQPFHLLLSVLAMVDLFVCLIYIPSHTLLVFQESSHKQYSIFDYCHVIQSIFTLIQNISLSITTQSVVYLKLSSISKEKTGLVFSLLNTVIFILATCSIHIILTILPHALWVGYEDINTVTYLCNSNASYTPTQNNADIKLYLSFMGLLHATQIFCTTILYITIHISIMKSKNLLNSDPNRGDSSQTSFTRALVTTTIALTSFIICCVPYYIVIIINNDHSRTPPVYYKTAWNLLLIKSVVNPIIYLYGVRSVRLQVKFFCHCRNNSPKKLHSSSEWSATASSVGGDHVSRETLSETAM